MIILDREEMQKTDRLGRTKEELLRSFYKEGWYDFNAVRRDLKLFGKVGAAGDFQNGNGTCTGCSDVTCDIKRHGRGRVLDTHIACRTYNNRITSASRPKQAKTTIGGNVPYPGTHRVLKNETRLPIRTIILQ